MLNYESRYEGTFFPCKVPPECLTEPECLVRGGWFGTSLEFQLMSFFGERRTKKGYSPTV